MYASAQNFFFKIPLLQKFISFPRNEVRGYEISVYRCHELKFVHTKFTCSNQMTILYLCPDLFLKREPSLSLVNGYFECSLSNLPLYLYAKICFKFNAINKFSCI